MCSLDRALVFNLGAQVPASAVLHQDVEVIVLPPQPKPGGSHRDHGEERERLLRVSHRGGVVGCAEVIEHLEEGFVVGDDAHVFGLGHHVALVEGVDLREGRQIQAHGGRGKQEPVYGRGGAAPEPGR